MGKEGLYGPTALGRISSASAMGPEERAEILQTLSANTPYPPWPRGMPTSVNPLVVIVGVSPGASPAHEGPAFLGDYTPTFGVPAPGFNYRDTSFYWDKVRLLATGFVRLWGEALDERDCLALSGHLNLGTGMFGSASAVAVESDVVRWVSDVLPRLHPRLVIGLGLVGLLTNRSHGAIREAWVAGGLSVDWLKPELITYSEYRFRRYRTYCASGDPIDFILWPNHPSRPPFVGPPRPGGRWFRAVSAGANVARQLLGREDSNL